MAGKRQIQQTRKNAPMLIYYQEGCTLISHGGKKLFMGALILILTQVALTRTPCVSVFYLNLGSCVVTTPTSSSEGLKSMERTVDRQEIAV